MNLITNRCLGAYIYRDLLKEQYKNPFIWTGISDIYFNLLFSDYNKINFNNIESGKNSNEMKDFYIMIDNQIKVDYQHIIYSENEKLPKIKGNNVYINTPITYMVKKYNERLLRMSEIPTFIYMDLDFTKNYNISNLALKLKKEISIITVDVNFTKNEFTNMLYVNKKDWKKYDWWNYLKDNYSNEIIKLIN